MGSGGGLWPGEHGSLSLPGKAGRAVPGHAPGDGQPGVEQPVASAHKRKVSGGEQQPGNTFCGSGGGKSL